MSDRLDALLRRLPDEKMAAYLPTQISEALAARQARLLVNRRVRRTIAVGLVLCGMIGSSLVLVDAPTLTATVGPLIIALQSNPLDLLLAGLLSNSADWPLLTVVDLAPSLSAALVIGLTLLTVAAFGGVARLLANPPLEGEAS